MNLAMQVVQKVVEIGVATAAVRTVVAEGIVSTEVKVTGSSAAVVEIVVIAAAAEIVEADRARADSTGVVTAEIGSARNLLRRM